LNLQRGKGAYDKGDAASQPLFSFVDEKALSLPTFHSFIALLDNYAAATGVVESVDAVELAENVRFLNLIMDTAVMQYVHQYLLAKKITKAVDRATFISELNALWFGLYKRKVANDSSGFEHVFVGEITDNTGKGKENEVIGEIISVCEFPNQCFNVTLLQVFTTGFTCIWRNAGTAPPSTTRGSSSPRDAPTLVVPPPQPTTSSW
jgi:hypothetical protein